MQKMSGLIKFSNRLMCLAFFMLVALVPSVQAGVLDGSSWYLHVDLAGARKSELKKIFTNPQPGKSNAHNVLNKVLGPEMAKQLDEATIYAETRAYKTFTLVLSGRFSKTARASFFSRMAMADEYSTSTYHGSTIYHFTVDKNDKKTTKKKTKKSSDSTSGDTPSQVKFAINMEYADKPLKLHAAQVNNSLVVVSRDQSELKRWLDHNRQLKDLKAKGLVALFVDLEKSLADGALNLDKADIGVDLHSEIMRKVKKIAFSVREDKGGIMLAIALTTQNAAMALQLKNIANGLLALQALSDDKADKDTHKLRLLTQKMTIDVKDSSLLIKAYLSAKTIQHLSDDKKQPTDRNVK